MGWWREVREHNRRVNAKRVAAAEAMIAEEAAVRQRMLALAVRFHGLDLDRADYTRAGEQAGELVRRVHRADAGVPGFTLESVLEHASQQHFLVVELARECIQSGGAVDMATLKPNGVGAAIDKGLALIANGTYRGVEDAKALERKVESKDAPNARTRLEWEARKMEPGFGTGKMRSALELAKQVHSEDPVPLEAILRHAEKQRPLTVDTACTLLERVEATDRSAVAHEGLRLLNARRREAALQAERARERERERKQQETRAQITPVLDGMGLPESQEERRGRQSQSDFSAAFQRDLAAMRHGGTVNGGRAREGVTR